MNALYKHKHSHIRLFWNLKPVTAYIYIHEHVSWIYGTLTKSTLINYHTERHRKPYPGRHLFVDKMQGIRFALEYNIKPYSSSKKEKNEYMYMREREREKPKQRGIVSIVHFFTQQ